MMENLKRLHLTDGQLKKLQAELLDLLIEFDRICNKYDIPYFLYGGTLLGAIRHKGFIPWDEGIDDAMFRDDYNKCKSIVELELDKDKYFLQNQQTNKYYNRFYARIRKNNTENKRKG